MRVLTMPQRYRYRAAAATLLLAALIACAAPVQAARETVRVDYHHTGDAASETFSLHRVVIEPLPWPGHPGQPIDTLRRGHFLFQVEDPETGAVLYSRGYSSIFQEWQHTAEARGMTRTFHESVRFPKPDRPVRLRILKRGADHDFATAWTVAIDSDDLLVQRAHAPPPAPVLDLHVSGDPARKVDVVVLGEGYTAAEAAKFEADARRIVEALLAHEPFAARADDFNFRGIAPPAAESGVNRPSSGTYRYSPSGTTYDAFGAERYVLAFDNPGLRRIIQHVPYEFVIVLVNAETYGGGGIYGLYSTAAADSGWAEYLVVHEFGHHFAALADEYYTSDAVYEARADRPEPWEPNVTALHDPSRLKWGRFVAEGTNLPTPWPKAEFEAFQRKNQAERARLRTERRPESEMNALFGREQAFVEGLFAAYPESNTVIGAFEGAHYAAQGYYRPEMNCLMFTRHDRFCRVCREAIEQVIDLYSAGD